MSNYFIGIDVGSSSVKTAIFDGDTGRSVARMTYPPVEQAISSPKPGWAEQDPEMWWNHFLLGYDALVAEHDIDTILIRAIGISYQMHGLVVVDKSQSPLRDAIIWCDSRAVEVGARAFAQIGAARCLPELLNSPGNFTASKLAWVKENEPEKYAKVSKFMLPGDYMAMRLTGRITTTLTGLSEGVFLDFGNRAVSNTVVNHFGFDRTMIPDVVPAIGDQGTVAADVAARLGLAADVRVTYRAGDQPNNALSLNVRNPGDVAATAGTSGVIYAVTDKDVYDPLSRINTFLHPTDASGAKRNGILICVNGTGILYSWLRRLFATGTGELTYDQLNEMAAAAPVGADGLLFYPFGNGAERILENRRLNGSIVDLDFNRHDARHVARAGIEGIVFALNLGFEILNGIGVESETIRAGNANLFLSPTFRTVFANVTGCTVEIYDTDGSDGAARAAALGAGHYATADEAFHSLELVNTVAPDESLSARYRSIFDRWKANLPEEAAH